MKKEENKCEICVFCVGLVKTMSSKTPKGSELTVIPLKKCVQMKWVPSLVIGFYFFMVIMFIFDVMP